MTEPSSSSPPVLVVPGWQSSGPDHWQSRWERERPGLRRVEQHDWQTPQPRDWVDALDRAILDCEAAPVLVAHSLGCIAVVRWASERGGGGAAVAGALLVAPADVERAAAPPEIRAFAPIPTTPLPFRAIVVASTNDPYLDIVRAGTFAASWGAELVNVGEAGHINTAAGHGPWPQGEALLDGLLTYAAARTS